MHQIQLRQMLRDADVAFAIVPIVRKHLLSLEQTAEVLSACGVDRPINVARLAVARLRVASLQKNPPRFKTMNVPRVDPVVSGHLL